MADRKQNIPQVVIKKYANRRLYNTSTSTYVTLEDLCDMVKQGIDFGVYDAKNGDDLTRSVLTQIIVEQESKGVNLLPTSFMKKLISFYGGNMQMVVPKYLEEAMHSFVSNQERFQKQVADTFGGMFPGMSQLSEIGKQNMQMVERTMRNMWSPFGGNGGNAGEAPEAGAEGDVDRLKQQLDELQRQLNAMQKKPK